MADASQDFKALFWVRPRTYYDYEDFTEWTEVDIGANRIQNIAEHDYDIVGVDLDETVYLYKYYGPDYFEGDFIHDITVNCKNFSGNPRYFIWALAESANSWDALANGSLGLRIRRDTGTAKWQVWIYELGGNNDFYAHTDDDLNTYFYLTIIRQGTTLKCRIFDDSARTSFLDELSIALSGSGDDPFDYCMSCSDNIAVSGRALWLDILNLHFNGGVYSEELFAEFVVALSDSEDLFAEFTVRHEASQDLFADFTPIRSASADLFADFEMRQIGTEDLFAEFVIVTPTYRELFSKFIVRHSDSADLFADFTLVQSDSEDLLSQFLTNAFGQHIKGGLEWIADNYIAGSRWTAGSIKGRMQKIVFFHEHTGTPDNTAKAAVYTVNASNYPENKIAETGEIALTSLGEQHFELSNKPVFSPGDEYFLLIRVLNSATGDSKLRYKTTGTPTKGFTKAGTTFPDPMTGGASRSYEFTIYVTYLEAYDASADLKATFDVGQDSQDLKAIFQLPQEDLFAKFVVGQWQEDLLAEFIVRQSASQDLFARATIVQSATKDLFCEFITRQPAYAELFAEIRVNNYLADLFAKTLIRQSTSLEIFSEAVLRRSTSSDLFAEFIAAFFVDQDLPAEFSVRRTATVDLFAEFQVMHWEDLKAVIDWISTTGRRDNVEIIAEDWLAQWVNFVYPQGKGFISEPVVENDAVVKESGGHSLFVESVYEAHRYKEVTFGWLYGDTLFRTTRHASYKDLKAECYVMVDKFPLDDWKDVTKAMGWWFNPWVGVYLQVTPRDDHLEIVGFNPLDFRWELGGGGLWVSMGTFKTYLEGTWVWEAELLDPQPDQAGPEYGCPVVLGGLNTHFSFFQVIENLVMVWYDPTADRVKLSSGKDGTASHTTLTNLIDYTQKHIYKLQIESPSAYPPNGRARLWIDDVLEGTLTTNIPTDWMMFFFEVATFWVDANTRTGVKVYSWTDEP